MGLDVSKIDVYFYDFHKGVSHSFPIEEAAKGILTIKNLNKNMKFFIYVGGFKSRIEKKSTEHVKNTFRYIDNSYLIIVDHSAYTHENDGYKTSYERSVKHVPDIGKKVAEMLADLKAGGVSPKTIHGIGHSLGGQILGHVGENFIKLSGQKISRITALDPAGPCFVENSNEDNIRSGLADYVEIYHCNAGAFGSDKSLGDINFFVNGGKSQPSCGDTSALSISKALLASKCSHKICVAIWTASVLQRNWYPAYKCTSYKYFKHGKCSQNERTTAGFWNPGTAYGNYYFSTDGYSLS